MHKYNTNLFNGGGELKNEKKNEKKIEKKEKKRYTSLDL